MSTKKILVKKNKYMDSVFLMGITEKIKDIDGLTQAMVLMGTDANIDMFKEAGFIIKDATAGDLVIAIEAKSTDTAIKIIKKVEDLLYRKQTPEEKEQTYGTLTGAIENIPEANLCIISVPGEHAASEAKKALESGMNVFIFSNNVPIDDELKLKELGRKKGLLVMGPDAGVGVINGIALATASAIEKGPIGIVGASGSGAQEVSCIIDKCGLGISQLIGTGGRDLYPEIGGISMLGAIDILEEDKDTEIIVLVSKLADKKIVKKILSKAEECKKPVVTIFLGADKKTYAGYNNIVPAFSLEEAALKAVSTVRGKDIKFGLSSGEANCIIKKEVAAYSPTQKYLRGLYCGGTFCEEALAVSKDIIENNIYANLSTDFAKRLDDVNISKENTLIDMGDEEFTKDRPHPVFDIEARRNRFIKEAEDSSVAVIILDFILGYGVHPDPVGELVDTIRVQRKKAAKSGRNLTIISSICGSKKDPQDIALSERLLKDAGVIVVDSNIQSARLAASIISKIESGWQ